MLSTEQSSFRVLIDCTTRLPLLIHDPGKIHRFLSIAEVTGDYHGTSALNQQCCEYKILSSSAMYNLTYHLVYFLASRVKNNSYSFSIP